ncbi:conserved hypothetical protein [delta proteobacterium NaphS2]|nr:conserved hypothetical protein [delta proteobacterium NaphS2]
MFIHVPAPFRSLVFIGRKTGQGPRFFGSSTYPSKLFYVILFSPKRQIKEKRVRSWCSIVLFEHIFLD